MSEPIVIRQTADGVACITLNNHARRNAMSRDMAQALDEALVAAACDSSARAIVLTGAGTAFCSGGDIERLKETATGGAPQVRSPIVPDEFFNVLPDTPPAYRSRYTFAMAIPKPVIAAVNGPAVGAGFLLALYCDVRFASRSAAFMAGFARIGATPELGMAWALPQIIGAGRAREMMLSGRRVEAEEALAIGLVSRVVEPTALIAETLAYAKALADGISPRSVRVIKRQMREGPGQTFDQAYESSGRDAEETTVSADFLEGLAAAQEKRPPRFSGC